MLNSQLVLAGVGTIVGLWLALGAVMTARQRELVFGRVRPSRARPRSLSHRTRTVTIHAYDGVRLSGWLMRPRVVGPHPAVIYFGGRADDVARVAHDAATLFPGMTVLAVNYRGYGRSQGKPGERQIVADARMLFDWVAELGYVDAKRIAIVGRSLGTGVAVQLAVERPICALVLVTPYDSLVAIAKRRARGLPVRYLLRHRFESIKYAPWVTAPTFVLRAETDKVVPRRHTDRLVQYLPSIYGDEVVPDSTHSDILRLRACQKRIAAFLTSQFNPKVETSGQAA